MMFLPLAHSVRWSILLIDSRYKEQFMKGVILFNKRKDKKADRVPKPMLAERMRRLGSFAALAMFFFASVSTSQLMFLDLNNSIEDSLVHSSSRSVDSDLDGILDADDTCPTGDTGWTSNSTTDHDSDGSVSYTHLTLPTILLV